MDPRFLHVLAHCGEPGCCGHYAPLSSSSSNSSRSHSSGSSLVDQPAASGEEGTCWCCSGPPGGGRAGPPVGGCACPARDLEGAHHCQEAAACGGQGAEGDRGAGQGGRGSRRSLIGLPPTIQRAPGEDTDAPGGGEAQEAKAWQEGALSDPFEWLCADSCDFATFGLTPTAGTVVKHRSMQSTGSPFPHQNTKITDFFLPAKRPPGSPGAGPKVAANEDTVAVPLPTAEAEEAEDQQEGAVGDRLQPCAESGEPVPNRWVGSQPALPFPPTMQPSAMARQEAWDFDTAALLTTTAAPVGRVGGEAPISSDEAAEAQGTPEPFSARADQGGVAQVHEEEEADKRPWSEAEETSWPNRRGNGDLSTEDVENSNVNRRHLMQAAELAARKAFIRTLQPQAPARLDWADIGEDQDDEDGADIADIHFLEPRQPGRPHGRPPDDKVPRDQGAKAHIDNFAVHDPPQVAMASNTGTTCLAEKQLHGENWGPDGAQILAKGGLRKGARSITPPVVLGVDSTLPFGGAWRGAADGVGMQSQQACAPPCGPEGTGSCQEYEQGHQEALPRQAARAGMALQGSASIGTDSRLWTRRQERGGVQAAVAGTTIADWRRVGSAGGGTRPQ